MEYPIKVNYQYTNNMYRAKQWLDNLPDLFAADFEVSSKYTLKDNASEILKVLLDTYSLEKLFSKEILFKSIDLDLIIFMKEYPSNLQSEIIMAVGDVNTFT